MIEKFLLFCSIIAFSIFGTGSPSIAREQHIVGYVEAVKIFPSEFPLKAKLDTGARTSSIDVRSIKHFTRKGEKWVKFSVESNDGSEIEFERPIVRISKIKRAGVDRDERPVIVLPICLGRVLKDAEVNLTERPKMNYRLLLGRLFLSDDFLVDSGQSHLSNPTCRKRKEK